MDVLDRPNRFSRVAGYPEYVRVRRTPARISKVSGVVELVGSYKVQTIRDKNKYIDHENGDSGAYTDPVYIRPGRSIYTSRSDVILQISGVSDSIETIRVPKYSELSFDTGVYLNIVK